MAVDIIARGLAASKADLVDGKVPASQLPSYVDEIVEYSSLSEFPETGESGKIYVAKDTNKTYRWSGTQYTEINGGSAEAIKDVAALPTTGINDKILYRLNGVYYIYTDNAWKKLITEDILTTKLAEKQDTLIAGSNISIAADGKTISATDTVYTAGSGILINDKVISIDSSVGIAIYDNRIDDANKWLTNGYCKTSAETPTANLPSVCTAEDRWGVLLYVAENNENKAGLQQYFPIDGNYKGRVFYRSVTGYSAGVDPEFGNWNLVPWSAEKQDTLVSGTNIKTINGTSILGSGDITAVGPKGDTGDTGPQGPQGPQGEKGEDGLTTKIEVNGNTYEQVSGTITLPNYPTVPTKTSQLTNDSGFLTSHQSIKTVNNQSLIGTGNITISADATIGQNFTTDITVGHLASGTVITSDMKVADILYSILYQAKILTGISVTNPPSKTSYTTGETFSTTGMEITATYNDSSTVVVHDYSVTPSGALAKTDTAVTITYTEGSVTKTTTQAITVTDPATSVTVSYGGGGDGETYEEPTEADLATLDLTTVDDPDTNLVGTHKWHVTTGGPDGNSKYTCFVLPLGYSLTKWASDAGGQWEHEFTKLDSCTTRNFYYDITPTYDYDQAGVDHYITVAKE